MEENLFADDNSVTIIEEKSAVIVAPRFDELAAFFNQDSKADAIALYLGETYNHAEAYTISYAWAELFDRLKKILVGQALNSTNDKTTEIKFNGKTVATLSERSLPKKYEYRDPVLARMEAQLEQLKADIKDRKTMSEKLKSEIADTETGEIIKPAIKKEVGVTVAVKLVEAL